MTDVDVLIKEKFVSMKNRGIEAFSRKHPHIFGFLNNYFTGKNNKVV